MKRTFMGALVALLAALPGTAGACGLDDCALPHALHLVDDLAPADAFAWMNHDLALARDAAHHHNRAQALQLTATLDRAMRARLDELVQTRGSLAAVALHEALQDVVAEAGGFPLAPLPLASARTLARN